jgi:hypothetical protein
MLALVPSEVDDSPTEEKVKFILVPIKAIF